MSFALFIYLSCLLALGSCQSAPQLVTRSRNLSTIGNCLNCKRDGAHDDNMSSKPVILQASAKHTSTVSVKIQTYGRVLTERFKEFGKSIYTN